jgi:hypothetical protein
MAGRTGIRATTTAVLGALALAAPAATAEARSPAACGPADRPEPALQGQVPLAAQGDESRAGFWCNMRLVGHTDIDNRGANYGMAWIGDCAYVTTFRARSESAPAGLAVIDVSDPARPTPVEYHTSPGSLNAVETLHAREAPGRRILVSGDYDGNALDVYDASDCRHPQLRATFASPYNIHNVTLSHDARTVYVGTALPTSESNQPAPHILVVDIADPAEPRLRATISMHDLLPQGARPAPLGVHRVDVNEDGTRLYAGVITATFAAPLARPALTGGELAILDTTEIAEGRPSPRVRLVSQVASGFHGPRLFRTGGRTYVVSGDEAVTNTSPATSCGGPFPVFADVTDERAPRPAGEFALEINRPEHCAAALQDDLLYSTHYTDVDDPRDAALGLFPMYNSGLRVADIRDPRRPVEIGYFNPPTDRDTLWGGTYGRKPDVIDLTPTNVRYRPETGHIWMASISSGFRVVELTPTGPAADLGLPAAPRPGRRACRRTVRLHVRAPGRHRLRSARVYVNGRRVRSLRGRHLRVPVTVRVPAGPSRVRIVARTRGGKQIVRARRYPGCRRG